MDPAATAVWSAASRPAYDERGFGDFYRGSGSGLGGAAAGHLESSGSAPWSAPPVSLAPTGLEDRQHEDTKSGLLGNWSDKSGAGGGVGGQNDWTHLNWYHHLQLQQASAYAAGIQHDLYGVMDSKMLENGDGLGGYGRPQSSTSLSPPASGGLVVPQPLNPRLPNNMIGSIGNCRKYMCKMCPQGFASKADLQLHTQIHLREPKPYKCATCGKAFANSSYLSQHTRIHLGIKPYRCEICQRKFTQLSHLQQHIRTHTGDKPYKCRIPGCTKAFSQLSNLQSHSRCHQTDKPHKCQSCYKCFADEAALLEHIPKHKESKHVKTHICPYCGKSYTQESYLAKHMQKHSDRMDKRAPVNCGGAAGTGLEYLSKLDMSAWYSGYQHMGAAGVNGDHPRLPDVPETRDPYTWDPRNSSAFSAVTTSAPTDATKTFDPLGSGFHKQNGQDLKVGAGLNTSLSTIRSYADKQLAPIGQDTK